MGTSECKRSKNSHEIRSILVDGKNVQESSSEKLLGTVLNNNLSWSSHLKGDENHKGLYAMLSQRIGFLKKLSYHCDKKSMTRLAHGIFYSKLQCNLPLIVSTWNLDLYKDSGSRVNNFSKDDCRKMQVLQNQVCRIILGKQWLYLKQSIPTEQLLSQCKQLSIHQLGVYSTLMMVKKSLLSGLPGYFSEKLKINNKQVNLRRKEFLEPITANLNVSRSSFFYRGVKLFNSLPGHLQQETRIAVFKKEIKKWILENISIKP